MTQVESTTDPDTAESTAAAPSNVSRRAWLGLAGAGLAGAAVLSSAKGAAAADTDPAVIGALNEGDTATSFENTTVTASVDGAANALVGLIESATNGSTAILATTAGDGHALAGFASKVDSASSAISGVHEGTGAGVEGENQAADVPDDGPANGVKGNITEATNNSAAVLGTTGGGGHAIAGVIDETAPNIAAATYGQHGGAGAGVGGVSADGYGGEFAGGMAAIRLIPTDVTGPPTDDEHLRGELIVDAVGDIWHNVDDGANFTRLNSQGPTTLPGAINLLVDPKRAYDSRKAGGKFTFAEIRKVNLVPFGVPAGVQGAVINLTVTETDAGGYVTVFNGDSVTKQPESSSINWKLPNTDIANSIPVAIGADGSVNVYSNSVTHVVIDVIGYIL